jgi:predicted transcriptional regulator
VFIDAPLFRTIIPLVRYTMSNFANQWFDWLELDAKWLPQLTTSLQGIEIDGKLQSMDWDEQVAYLVDCWIEKGDELKILKANASKEKGTSLSQKGHKSENDITADNQYTTTSKGTSPNVKGYKSVDDLPNKRMRYLIIVLLMLGAPLSVDDLMLLFGYNHKGKFRDNYIKPLESVGFITKTNPDKPTASNQKYQITENGKRFLTGQSF